MIEIVCLLGLLGASPISWLKLTQLSRLGHQPLEPFGWGVHHAGDPPTLQQRHTAKAHLDIACIVPVDVFTRGLSDAMRER